MKAMDINSIFYLGLLDDKTIILPLRFANMGALMRFIKLASENLFFANRI